MTRSKWLSAMSGLCMCTVKVEEEAARSAIDAGIVVRPQLISTVGNGGGGVSARDIAKINRVGKENEGEGTRCTV